MILLKFLHSAKPLNFSVRTVEPPRENHEGTEKLLLEHPCEYKHVISVPGRRVPRARLQSTSDKQEVLARSLQQDVALLDCNPFSAGLSARAVPAGVAAFHYQLVSI